MRYSWKIGSVFGIDIFVHWSFLLLPAWVFISNWQISPLVVACYLVLLTISVFGCIVLHELGHALMARHFGIGTRDITLYPIGGIARLERMSERPWEEFWIAVAGPAVNVVIALVLGGVLLLARLPFIFGENLHFIGFGMFPVHLLVANMFLALFNLVPAFPMDGGRVLRALLASAFGHLRATELAVAVGLCLSMVFFVLAVRYEQPGLILLTLFLFFLGQQELTLVRRREALRRAEPLDVIPVLDPVSIVAPEVPGGFSGFTWDGQARLWVEWRNGQPIHTISVDRR